MSVESSDRTPTHPEAEVAFASLPVGSRLGRYQIVQRIARGGMAELYTARAGAEGGFEKLVALKRILPHLSEDASFVRMFLNEARVAAALDHSNIAHVVDFGSVGREHYLVMEYVHGHSVQELLRTTAGRERIPLGVALTVAYELATALHYAHEKRASDGRPLGLVHRDVSPSNVLLSEYGGVKLVDFGIAKATEHTRATESGVIKGKLAYMAPEQVRGESLDRRADVFALGVVTYELTTGRKCFRAAGEFALINRVAQGRYARPSSLDPAFPRQLEAILAEAMAVDPAQRLPTAEAFARAITRYAEGAGISMSRLGLADYLGTVFEPKPPPPTLAPTAPPVRAVPSDSVSSQPRVPASTGVVLRRNWRLAGATMVVGLGLGLGVASATGALFSEERLRAVAESPATTTVPEVPPPTSVIPPAPTNPVASKEPTQSDEPAPLEAPTVEDPPAGAPKKTRKPRRKQAKPRPTTKAPEYLPPSYR